MYWQCTICKQVSKVKWQKAASVLSILTTANALSRCVRVCGVCWADIRLFGDSLQRPTGTYALKSAPSRGLISSPIYDSIFRPHESLSQTASRSVQLFLHSTVDICTSRSCLGTACSLCGLLIDRVLKTADPPTYACR